MKPTDQKQTHTHKWSSDTFADIADISQAHWHYEATPDASQTALRIEFPGHRVSIQLDRQILAALDQNARLLADNAALVAALEKAERLISIAHIETCRKEVQPFLAFGVADEIREASCADALGIRAALATLKGPK